MEIRTRPALARAAALAAAVLAACALCLTLAPKAQAAESYPIYIGGTQVTSENAADVFGDGTVSYDAATATLTLTDATITQTGTAAVNEYKMVAAIYEGCDDPFTIELVGDNTIKLEDDLTDVGFIAGILSTGSDFASSEDWSSFAASDDPGEPAEPEPPTLPTPNLYITGEGTLTIDIEAASDQEVPAITGIYMYGDDIAKADANVSISVDATNVPYVEYVKGFHGMVLTLSGGTFDAYATGGEYAYGDYCMFTFVTGDAVATLESGSAYDESAGLLGGLFAYENADVTARAGQAPTSCGIEGFGPVVVMGNSKVVAASTATPVEKEPILNPSPSPEPLPIDDSTYAGIMGTPTVGKNATLIATGAQGAILSGGSIDVDSAIVSMDHGLTPRATAVWDGETPLSNVPGDPEASQATVPENLYKYVRIPGTPLASRIAGDYANETSAKIAANTFFESEYVVIARDDDFADALGATGLAGALECPIVLTDRMGLSEAAAKEITRLGATKAYVIGGTGAIPEQMDADLAELGVTSERVFGENSYDTSLACAKKIEEVKGKTATEAIVAVSFNFQDALSVSPLAYMFDAPIVLQTWGDTAADRGFTDEAKAWLEGKELVVVGGVGAISDESLDGLHPEIRLWGEDGYETSNAIAEFGYKLEHFSGTDVVFACGAQAAKGVDALAGSALAGKLRAPILLVNGQEEMEAVNTYTVDNVFADHAADVLNVYILGGSYVMPQDIVDKIESMLTE